jgi:hypothetical protein
MESNVQERVLLEPAVRTADHPLGPDQYRYVATRGWWMGSFGTSGGMLLHLTEQWIRQWIPARPERDWLLDRDVTGRVCWLTGSAEEAQDEGFTLTDAVPTGRYRAPHGDFYAALDDLAPRRRPGAWHTPTAEFLARLPRDPQALLIRLQADGPEGRTASQPFARAVGALRSGLVPADLRAALYDALVELPAVSLDENATGLDGCPRVALVHDDGPTRTELLVDPADGSFAGERDTLRVASRLGLAVGTVVLCTAVVGSVVDTLGGLPG